MCETGSGILAMLSIGEARVFHDVTETRVEVASSRRSRPRSGSRKRPAGVLIGFQTEDDWFEYRLEHHPEFLRRVSEARAAIRTGLGTCLEDLQR
jgi:hypothetical protein